MTGPYPISMPTTNRPHLLKIALSVLLCVLMQACAAPADKLNSIASDQGFKRSEISAAGFDLLVYRNQIPAVKERLADVEITNQSSSILHIYLEGDGSPWAYRTIVMPDPTPRNPLMLGLMALDPQQASYLGRPCYNGTAEDRGCDNSLWTSARYSDPIVASMASGIRVLARDHEATDIRLFGHSGGGALAMLLAEQVPMVTHVITIAGNLDIDAWTRHHQYSPLYSSLNPARQPSLRPEVEQWHLIGGRDGVIPPQLIRPFIMSQQAASGYLLDDFTHGCCWRNIWPRVLYALAQNKPERVPGQRFKLPERSVGVLGNQ